MDSEPTDKKLYSVRVILKSGAEFTVKTEEFSVRFNPLGGITSFDYSGCVENAPMYLDLSQVSAIVNETPGE